VIDLALVTPTAAGVDLLKQPCDQYPWAPGMAQDIAKLRQAFCIAKHFARRDSHGTSTGPRLTVRIDVDFLDAF
jgi:hypothetical protein